MKLIFEKDNRIDKWEAINLHHFLSITIIRDSYSHRFNIYFNGDIIASSHTPELAFNRAQNCYNKIIQHDRDNSKCRN